MPNGHLFTVIDELKKKYGPIIGYMAFGQPIVFMDGADIIHAALRKEEFQSRPDFFSIQARTFGKNLGKSCILQKLNNELIIQDDLIFSYISCNVYGHQNTALNMVVGLGEGDFLLQMWSYIDTISSKVYYVIKIQS